MAKEAKMGTENNYTPDDMRLASDVFLDLSPKSDAAFICSTLMRTSAFICERLDRLIELGEKRDG